VYYQKQATRKQLFDPPFDKSSLNPGYIKGYVPGVRENGGQYTHAAIWLVMAYAALKDKDTTWQLLQMINPINRGRDANNIAVYKVEPYVMAADVYAVSTHLGGGGWTWYTGSAGWMYQLITSSFVGMQQHDGVLTFDPCIPQEWNECKVNYTFQDTEYKISIIQNSGATVMKVFVDDQEQQNKTVALRDDKLMHTVKVILS
jgi:cyclic beta-1,2-glucan synthetase